MWNGDEVSVVLMTYAERDSIREVIEGFFARFGRIHPNFEAFDHPFLTDNIAQPLRADVCIWVFGQRFSGHDALIRHCLSLICAIN